MRTKEEEHKLIETFDQTTAAIRNDSRPAFSELLKATEEYQKSLAQTVFCGQKVTELMKRIATLSPDPEMTKGLEDVAEILTTREKHDDELSKFLLNEILVPMRQQHDEEKKALPEFIKKVKAQRKQSEKAVKDAELAAKKPKKGADLKTLMEEISKQEQLRQQQLSEQLKEALQAQRSKFCLYVKCWNEMYSRVKVQDEEISSQISAASDLLKKLGESANEISAAQVDLVTERKRTFINLSNISEEWKKIFKDAGISKKDLRDSETARVLLETLERAGINTSSLTGESFSSIGDEGGDDGASPAPPPRGGAPPPPPRGGAPPPPPRGGGAPAPPSRGPPPPPARGSTGPSYLKGGAGAPPAPPAPAAPNAPPPPPPARGGAPPPPPARSPSASGGGGASLLDQIHQGTKLKSAADRKDPDPPKSSPSSFSGADLTSMLMSAMATRRTAMKEEAKDDDDDWGDDNDEWSD